MCSYTALHSHIKAHLWRLLELAQGQAECNFSKLTPELLQIVHKLSVQVQSAPGSDMNTRYFEGCDFARLPEMCPVALDPVFNYIPKTDINFMFL